MSKGNNDKSSGPPAPAPPKPQNEYFYENDFLRSQRVYDKTKKSYINTSYTNPQEQGIENTATNYINDLVQKFPKDMNLSPERIAEYGDAYAQPQIAALDDSYNKAKGLASMAASGRGMQNSVGFSNYQANQIEKNRAQGLADIASNRKMMELDLPNKMLTPYVNQFNLVNAALQGQQASMSQDLEPSFQGSQASNNQAMQNYQNQMNYWQTQQGQGGSGKKPNFFGWLVGKNSLY